MKLYFSTFLAAAAISMNTFCSAHESSVDHVHEIDFKWNIEDTTLIESLSDMSTTYEEETEKIYLVGGCNDPQGNAKAPDSDYSFCNTITDSTYSFDPVTKEIKKLANAPRARYRHTAAAVDGNIYVLGGRTVPDDVVIPEIDVYYPIEDVWKTVAVLPQDLATSDQAAFGYEHYLYVLGGYYADYEATNKLARLNTKEVGQGWEMMAPLADARGDIHAATIGGFAYTAGGFTHEDGFCHPHVSAERYDIEQDTWTTLDDMGVGRADKAMVALDNVLFAIGGESNNACTDLEGFTTAVRDVEFLADPEDDDSEWIHLAPHPEERFRFSGAAHPSTKTIYTFGGQEYYNENCECFRTSDKISSYTEYHVDSDDGASSGSGRMSLVLSSVFTGLAGLWMLIN